MKATNIEWDVTDGAEEMTQEEINYVLTRETIFKSLFLYIYLIQ